MKLLSEQIKILSNDFNAKNNLVDALLKCPSVQDNQIRNSIVSHLPAEVSSNLPRNSIPRIDVLEIVGRLLDYSEAVTAFLSIVYAYEGDSIPWGNVEKLILSISHPVDDSEDNEDRKGPNKAPEYSRKFVNRDKQWSGFLKLLNRETGRQIITVEASQRMGKTWLIQKMSHEASRREISFSLWDFARPGPWDYLSLVRRTRDHIGTAYFNHMTQVINEATSSSRLSPISPINFSPTRGVPQNNSIGDNFRSIPNDNDIVRRNLEIQITDAFLQCLKTLPQEKPVLFLLDAVERASESTIYWIINNLLEQIRFGTLPNLLMVIAGRTTPKLNESWDPWVGRTDLNMFDKKHISELFEKHMEEQQLIPDMEKYLDKYDPHMLELLTKGHPDSLGSIFSNIFVDKIQDEPEDWI